jgi:predicted O-methyltransferase YrrM
MRLPLGTRQAAVWGLIAGTAGLAGTALCGLLGLTDLAFAVPVGILAAIAAAGTRLQIAATRLSSSDARKGFARTSERLRDLTAVAEFSGMDVPYPLPLGGSHALKWDGSAILAREIAVTRPATILELGSGGSTLVIGLMLQRLGHGHLWSLDHEPAYAARTRAHVRAMGLESQVTVVDAPLIDVVVRERRYRWYDLGSAGDLPGQLDFLVVDGPPQTVDPEGEPRYPALPLLADRLRTGAVVFVDDASRAAETRMIARWLADEPGWTAQLLKTQAGTAILHRAGSAAS